VAGDSPAGLEKQSQQLRASRRRPHQRVRDSVSLLRSTEFVGPRQDSLNRQCEYNVSTDQQNKILMMKGKVFHVSPATAIHP
jgi:hypothetical protein